MVQRVFFLVLKTKLLSGNITYRFQREWICWPSCSLIKNAQTACQYHHLKLCWQQLIGRFRTKNCCMICTSRWVQPPAQLSTLSTGFSTFYAEMQSASQLSHFWTVTPGCLNFFMHNALKLRISCQQLLQECGQHWSIQPQKVVTKCCPQTTDFKRRKYSFFEF